MIKSVETSTSNKSVHINLIYMGPEMLLDVIVRNLFFWTLSYDDDNRNGNECPL